jgi:hypothetical protein
MGFVVAHYSKGNPLGSMCHSIGLDGSSGFKLLWESWNTKGNFGPWGRVSAPPGFVFNIICIRIIASKNFKSIIQM